MQWEMQPGSTPGESKVGRNNSLRSRQELAAGDWGLARGRETGARGKPQPSKAYTGRAWDTRAETHVDLLDIKGLPRTMGILRACALHIFVTFVWKRACVCVYFSLGPNSYEHLRKYHYYVYNISLFYKELSEISQMVSTQSSKEGWATPECDVTVASLVLGLKPLPV